MLTKLRIHRQCLKMQGLKGIVALAFTAILSLLTANSRAQLIETGKLDSLRMYHSLQSALENPDSVYRLDLSKTQLKEFPVEILKFKNLNELHLDKNKLALIPDEISTLSYLQILSCSHNRIETFPAGVLKLTHLTLLDFGDNYIDAIPANIDDLKELKMLILWDNPIEVYPGALGSLEKLEVLDLLHNQMSANTQDRLRTALPATKIIFSMPCRCEDSAE